MTSPRIDGPLLTFVLNATWQIPLVVAAGLAGAALLRRAGAGLAYALWMAVAVACALMPAAGMLRIAAGTAATEQAAMVTAMPSIADGAWRWLDWASATTRSAPVPPLLASIVALIGAAAATVQALRLLFGWLRARALVRRSWPVELPAPLQPRLERCGDALGVRDVPVHASAEVRGPITVGVRRPLIIVPHDFFARATDDEAIAALAHEMAHVRRRDYATYLFCELLLLSVAFHPAAHLVRRRLTLVREMACDEAVSATIGRRTYARSLLALAATVAGLARPTHVMGVLDAHTLEVRMKQVLDGSPRLGRRRARAALAAALLLLAGTGTGAALLAVPAKAMGSGDVAPFAGAWVGDWPADKDGNGAGLRALDLEIGADGAIVQTLYRYESQPSGMTNVGKVVHSATGWSVAGSTLTFTVHADAFSFRDEPPAPAEIAQSLQLDAKGTGVFRILSNSYFAARKQRGEPVPPPPPPIIMRRR